MSADHVVLDLPMSEAAPALARRAVGRLGLTASAAQTASLLVSELVSNALRHSGADAAQLILLRASVDDGGLRMSVTDAGAGFRPSAPRGEPGVAGGFGLFLVERLAHSWGVELGHGTMVWLELDAAAA